MKQRILALCLALGLVAGLTACGPKQPDQTSDPTPSTDPTQAATQTPVGTQAPDVPSLPDKGTPPADPTQNPPILTPGDPGYVDPDPTPAPDVTTPPQPTPTPAETPEPTPEPSDTPSIANSAANVYAAVSAVTGSGNLTDMSEVMDQFYNISTGDLEDFVFYMPAMNATIEEIFIGRAKPGKVDAVKAACQSRLDGLKEDGEFYPDTGVYLDGAKLEVSGDWVILAVCDKPDDAVKAFQNAVK